MKTGISIGDVCVDLAQGSKVQVVDVAADTAEEYREESDMDLTTYKSHPLFGVGENDRVLRCVYLGDSLKSLPSGSYDFPESRLARIPVEEAAEDIQAVQDRLAVDVLESVFDAMFRNEALDNDLVEGVVMHTGGVPLDVVDEAYELAWIGHDTDTDNPPEEGSEDA